ncbi:PA2779 family protein [Pseudomonas sp. CrR25]|nr:PA2779 family protein [Pseudomonas sp. CrR25]
MSVSTITLGVALLAVCLIAVPNAPAFAGMISTQEVLAEQSVQDDRDTVREFFHRANVEEQLQAMDVPAALARSRVEDLTPAEAATLAQRIDAQPAGGALSGNDLIIILLVAILVVLIL